MLASFAPPVVGILAQHVYGYKPTPKGSSNSAAILTDRDNAASLAKALYAAIGIPMAICSVIYSFLYYTYPRDRERAKMHALIESEIQLMEAGDSPSKLEGSQLCFSGSNEQAVKDRSDIEHGSHEGPDFDENVERTLLPSHTPLSHSRN